MRARRWLWREDDRAMLGFSAGALVSHVRGAEGSMLMVDGKKTLTLELS